jgi:nicotinate-nucleotide adenylyltransferase
MMKIGILGGTFDPPHNAHLEIAKRSIKQFDLDKVIFIPSGNPWQKKDATPFIHRYEMTKILIKDNNNFEISDVENNLHEPSYTIDTLKKLNLNKSDTYFILGSDAAYGITSWKSYKELDKYTNFLIAPREDVPNKNLKNIFPFEYQIIEGSYLDISSTNVRNIMNNKENLDNFIPNDLIEFIKEQSLYSL